MNQLQSGSHRPRFPLFSKIFAGFGLIIIFMIGSSVVILLQLKPLFSSDIAEFQNIQLSQYLIKIFSAENESYRKVLTTKDSYDERTLITIIKQFRTVTDSLLLSTERSETRETLKKMLDTHTGYENKIQKHLSIIKENAQYDTNSVLKEEQELVDTLHEMLYSLNSNYIPGVSRALKTFGQQTSVAMASAYITLALSFIVAIAVAVILARTITRPIQALKSATGKVGEGNYETVPISTNDEVADLTRDFNMMSDKLKQLDEMRIQLMQEISHEMRTPLQVIKAGCYTISHSKEGPVLTPRQRDACGMIQQAANRINHFVNSFLDIAKMEAGLMKYSFEDLNLVEVLNPLVEEAKLIGQTRQIKVEFIYSDIPILSIDKERLGQAFSNLLSNALKYTPDAGNITVRCEKVKEDNRIKVDVQDSGVGIPEADIEKLFTKFYQAKNKPLVKEKGSGLGLALVKHVSEAHGGSVGVKSKIGTGSTFTILLPIKNTNK